MLGIRLGHLVISPYNGERVKVEHLVSNDWLVRVPRAWGEAWISRLVDINDAVDAASQPTQQSDVA